jgi:glucosamine--fructose-6-phosphate aminotransferase (isomerizing)
VVLLTDADMDAVGCDLLAHVQMPKVHPFITPLLYSVPIQLIAYHTAVLMGTDVDQPRNLAKSVTVE